jgi:LacI family transcriptional regulator
MAITLKDIADQLGLSYTTVSRALNNHKEIKESTRKLVKETANSMGYLPNSIAKGLVMKKTKTIGIIVPDITDNFMAELAREIEVIANESGYTVFLCNTNWNKKRTSNYVKQLIERRVDGIIMIPTSEDISFLENALKYNTKIIFIGSSLKKIETKSIQVDNYKAVELSLLHLLNKDKNKIAYLGGGKELLANEERFLAFKKILKKNNLYNSKLVMNSHKNRKSGYYLMEELLTKNIKFDSIFAFNDYIAAGAIKKLNELNISIPNDVAIIGFDDTPICKFLTPELSTIKQPIKKMAKLAFDEILNEKENKKILLDPLFIDRETT